MMDNLWKNLGGMICHWTITETPFLKKLEKCKLFQDKAGKENNNKQNLLQGAVSNINPGRWTPPFFLRIAIGLVSSTQKVFCHRVSFGVEEFCKSS